MQIVSYRFSDLLLRPYPLTLHVLSTPRAQLPSARCGRAEWRLLTLLQRRDGLCESTRICWAVLALPLVRLFSATVFPGVDHSRSSWARSYDAGLLLFLSHLCEWACLLFFSLPYYLIEFRILVRPYSLLPIVGNFSSLRTTSILFIHLIGDLVVRSGSSCADLRSPFLRVNHKSPFHGVVAFGSMDLLVREGRFIPLPFFRAHRLASAIVRRNQWSEAPKRVDWLFVMAHSLSSPSVWEALSVLRLSRPLQAVFRPPILTSDLGRTALELFLFSLSRPVTSRRPQGFKCL